MKYIIFYEFTRGNSIDIGRAFIDADEITEKFICKFEEEQAKVVTEHSILPCQKVFTKGIFPLGKEGEIELYRRCLAWYAEKPVIGERAKEALEVYRE